MNIISKIKKMLCRHNYIQIGFTETYDNNIRFSMRHYACNKCNKTIWIDGRHDPYHR